MVRFKYGSTHIKVAVFLAFEYLILYYYRYNSTARFFLYTDIDTNKNLLIIDVTGFLNVADILITLKLFIIKINKNSSNL